MPYNNVSFDGTPVEFWLDSPLVFCFDPSCLDLLLKFLTPGSGKTTIDPGDLLERINGFTADSVSCYAVSDFQPGVYTLHPRDIRKFGDEDDEFDYGEEPKDDIEPADVAEDEIEPADVATSYPFFSVDSATMMLVDSSRLAQLVELLNWDKFDEGLGDSVVFAEISDAVGGPYFAIIGSASQTGIEFDGDGVYTIRPEAIRAVRRAP